LAAKSVEQIKIPPDGAEGSLMTHGGRFGGYGLFMENGKLIYVYFRE